MSTWPVMKDTLDSGVPGVPGPAAEVDDIDLLKQSQPRPQFTEGAEAYCACTVANLEGKHRIRLPWSPAGRMATLEQLDGRVRILEKTDNIDPPPPMDAPQSWDSLTWRILRLHQRTLGPTLQRSVPPHVIPSETLLTAMLNTMQATHMAFVPWQRLLGTSNPNIPGGKKEGNLDGTEAKRQLQGEELLCTAAQFLCHLAGCWGFKTHGSFELQYNCAFAIDLSLFLDSRNSRRGPFPPPRPAIVPGQSFFPPPTPPPPMAFPARKGCHCSCHSRASSKRPGRSDGGKRTTGFKARVGRMFGKLIFWRRRKGRADDSDESDSDTDSDASSISSRSTATFT